MVQPKVKHESLDLDLGNLIENFVSNSMIFEGEERSLNCLFEKDVGEKE